jgi:predicted CoA-binding protein
MFNAENSRPNRLGQIWLFTHEEKMASQKQRVVVVGASANPERYSNRAVRLLVQHGHEVVPVNPGEASIEGLPVVSELAKLRAPVDTMTFYISAKKSLALAESIVKLRPKRVIFNPGAENPALQATLETEGIHTENACTLVLLKTDQF